MGGVGAGPQGQGPPAWAGLPDLGTAPSTSTTCVGVCGEAYRMPLGHEPQPPLAAGASRRGSGRRAAVFPPYSSSLTCEKPHNCLGPTPYLLRNGVNNTWALRSQVWESPPPGPGQLPHFPILQVCASPTHLPGLSQHRAEPAGSAQPSRCCSTARLPAPYRDLPLNVEAQSQGSPSSQSLKDPPSPGGASLSAVEQRGATGDGM